MAAGRGRGEGDRPTRDQRSRLTTRDKLVAAAEQVIAEKGVERATISDITDAADVGVGSFYNHFASKAAIAEAVFMGRAQELAEINNRIFATEPDPARAIACIQKIFLTRAVDDPVWGWFLVNTSADMPQMWEVFARHGKAHLQRGVDAGRFAVADRDVAMRIILSALAMAMRQLMDGHASRSWANAVVQSLLVMLGVPAEEAKRLSRRPLPAYVPRMFAGREDRKAV